MKKTCNKCKKDKDESEFSKNLSNKKTGLSSYCKECMSKYNIQHYKDNIEAYEKRYLKQNKKSRKFLNDIKKGKSCEKCGYNKCIAALEFHHKDPLQKDFSISSLRQKKGITKESVLKEIEKCIILCANCHRELHYNNKKKSKE